MYRHLRLGVNVEKFKRGVGVYLLKEINIIEFLQMEIRKKYNNCYNFSNTKR